MALPASGQISLNDVNVELGNSGTAQIDMNSAAVRGLFGIPSGEIEMSDGYGKSNAFTFTVSSNTQEANLSTLATAAGWNGSDAVDVTISSGVYLWSDSTSNPGLLANVANCTIRNSGYIIGKGGNGSQYAGSSAGDALSVTGSSVTIINNSSGVIAGGGGGGGGSKDYSDSDRAHGGGGSGGGNGSGFRAGGGGSIGNLGSDGNFAGQGGSNATGGGGGGGGGGIEQQDGGGAYGAAAGGGRQPGNNTAGNSASGGGINAFGGKGGNWGAAGGSGSGGVDNRSGGAAGAAITNSVSYTLSNSGTVYGAT